MKHMKKILVSACIIGLPAFVAFVASCDNGRSSMKSSITWRTDKPPIEKRVSVISPIDACIWTREPAKTNSDRGLPAPKDYFVKGYIRISAQTTKALQKEYQWIPANMDIASIDRPTTASIADAFFRNSNYLESKDFMRRIGQSSIMESRVILNPDEMVLYFILLDL